MESGFQHAAYHPSYVSQVHPDDASPDAARASAASPERAKVFKFKHQTNVISLMMDFAGAEPLKPPAGGKRSLYRVISGDPLIVREGASLSTRHVSASIVMLCDCEPDFDHKGLFVFRWPISAQDL